MWLWSKTQPLPCIRILKATPLILNCLLWDNKSGQGRVGDIMQPAVGSWEHAGVQSISDWRAETSPLPLAHPHLSCQLGDQTKCDGNHICHNHIEGIKDEKFNLWSWKESVWVRCIDPPPSCPSSSPFPSRARGRIWLPSHLCHFYSKSLTSPSLFLWFQQVWLWSATWLCSNTLTFSTHLPLRSRKESSSSCLAPR